MTRPSVTEEETLESLGPYFFIQRKAGHRLTSDSIALSEFASQSLAENDNVIDLGTATGAIALLLAWKTKARSITGVEVEKAAFESALRNVEANGLGGRVKVINDDYRNLPAFFPEGAFSVVVCNPPYTKTGTGRVSPKKERAAGRSEIFGTLSDLVKVSTHLAGSNGKIFYVFPASRLAEIMEEAASRGLNVRRLRLLRTAARGKAGLFLIELGKDGGVALEEAALT